MRKNKVNIVCAILLFLSLIFIFSGISYSIFSYLGSGMTNNVIQTGRIIFSYSDAVGNGNGIFIENAVPVSDQVGKMLAGTDEYFDFSVFASLTSNNLAYEISVVKDEESTLDEQYVKIYLTTLEGNSESETSFTSPNANVITYADLPDTNNPSLTGKTIYLGNVQAGEIAYGKSFRLRMWVKDPEEEDFDYSLVNDKYFSVKVNVAARGNY